MCIWDHLGTLGTYSKPLSVFIYRWCGYTCIEYDLWSINTWGPKRSQLWIARYLMKFTMHFPCPCTSGIVLHAEALRLLPGRDSQPAQVLCNVIYWFGKTTRGLYGLRFGSDESAQFSNWRLCPPSHRQTSAAPMALPFGWNAGLALPCFTPLLENDGALPIQYLLAAKVNPHSTWRHGIGRKSEDGQAIKRYLLSGEGLDSRPVMVLVGSNGVTNRNII